MKIAIYLYAIIAGLYVSTVLDFIFVIIPLTTLLYVYISPSRADIYIFHNKDLQLADNFAEYLLKSGRAYDTATILMVDAIQLSKALDEEDME